MREGQKEEHKLDCWCDELAHDLVLVIDTCRMDIRRARNLIDWRFRRFAKIGRQSELALHRHIKVGGGSDLWWTPSDFVFQSQPLVVFAVVATAAVVVIDAVVEAEPPRLAGNFST